MLIIGDQLVVGLAVGFFVLPPLLFVLPDLVPCTIMKEKMSGDMNRHAQDKGMWRMLEGWGGEETYRSCFAYVWNVEFAVLKA